MNKRLLLAGAALSLLGKLNPAAADGVDGAAPPPVAFIEPWRWSGCYGGLHLGGAWADIDVRDPVQLVQDQILAAPLTTGVTTTATGPGGFIVGGQIGCDYQFSPNLLLGFEGSVSATTLKGSTNVGLPLGFPGDHADVAARTDMIPTLTARLGYSLDRWLFYARGGAAWASDALSVKGTFQGTPFDFQGLDLRAGWTVGAGVERAIWEHWSVRLEYDYYDLGHESVLMSDSTLGLSAPVDVRQTVQMIRLGLNFHPW